ncbi:MAG: MBL fold metallo-hydrolase [Gemmatimonadales bacterium]
MAREPLAPLLDKVPDGIFHAALPTPFPVGPVNCYLFAGDPVTVVDPGMMLPESIAMLTALLESAGLTVADIDVVFVTHGHPDHYGAAGWIAEQSGAGIVCGKAERQKLLGQMTPEYLALLVNLGIPQEIVDTFPDLRKATRDLIHTPLEADLSHRGDGEILTAGGRDFTVIETPGHAAGHLSLWDPEASVLLSGDHLLPHITPNPVLEPDDHHPGRRRSLIEYLDSLPRFSALAPAAILPGHGSPFTDIDALAANLRAHHQKRSERIVSMVEALGTPTPYEISLQLFPNLEGFAVMLGTSEAVGHLDLLAAEGRVRQVEDSPIRFALT